MRQPEATVSVDAQSAGLPPCSYLEDQNFDADVKTELLGRPALEKAAHDLGVDSIDSAVLDTWFAQGSAGTDSLCMPCLSGVELWSCVE